MRSETDCTSMKILLKQVYGIHTTKIKSLEDEIDVLKKNLQESEIKLKNCDVECKRCVELEEAFNSCKTALHEQTKWFENLGQKFSALNTSEDKTFGKKNENISSYNVNNGQSKGNNPQLDISLSTKMHFLKNIMSLNPDTLQESLDLNTAPFKENVKKEFSTLNPDSLVLVPNTMDFSCELLDRCKPIDDDVPLRPDCIESNSNETKKPVSTIEKNQESDNKNKSKPQKRSSDNSVPLEFFAEDFEEDSENQAYSFKKKLKPSAKTTENANVSVIEITFKEDASIRNQKSKPDAESSFYNATKNAIQTLDVKVQKTGNNDSPNVSCKKASIESCNNADISKDDFCQTVSPSLIPFKERTNSKVVIKDEPLSVEEDISDFQLTTTNKKISNDTESWKSCDKKKLSKKASNFPVIKSTSRFKIQLDSLPPNYKKPSYRQTKLSKSLFQAKPSCSTNFGTESELKNVETYLPQSPDVQSCSGAGKTPDFDATCIPDNYEYEAVSSEKKAKNRPFGNSIMLVKDSSEESEEESSAEMIVEQAVTTKDKGGKLSRKNNNKGSPNELTNSFDRLPKKPEPDYKYKEETVRKKSERKQLTAFDCNECEKYYSELGLSDEEKQLRKNKCSRHRAKFAPPPTPKHFWELEFPDTQECKARGYLDQTQKAKLKTHRKRPL